MRDTGSQVDVADRDLATDQEVLAHLLDGPGVWAITDLAREIGSDTDVGDSIARLRGHGLVHVVVDVVVFPSRAAYRAADLEAAAP